MGKTLTVCVPRLGAQGRGLHHIGEGLSGCLGWVCEKSHVLGLGAQVLGGCAGVRQQRDGGLPGLLKARTAAAHTPTDQGSALAAAGGLR